MIQISAVYLPYNHIPTILCSQYLYIPYSLFPISDWSFESTALSIISYVLYISITRSPDHEGFSVYPHRCSSSLDLSFITTHPGWSTNALIFSPPRSTFTSITHQAHQMLHLFFLNAPQPHQHIRIPPLLIQETIIQRALCTAVHMQTLIDEERHTFTTRSKTEGTRRNGTPSYNQGYISISLTLWLNLLHSSQSQVHVEVLMINEDSFTHSSIHTHTHTCTLHIR